MSECIVIRHVNQLQKRFGETAGLKDSPKQVLESFVLGEESKRRKLEAMTQLDGSRGHGVFSGEVCGRGNRSVNSL